MEYSNLSVSVTDFSDGAVDVSGLEARIAANISKQQANFERQDRLLAEIEREVGSSGGRHRLGGFSVTVDGHDSSFTARDRSGKYTALRSSHGSGTAGARQPLSPLPTAPNTTTPRFSSSLSAAAATTTGTTTTDWQLHSGMPATVSSRQAELWKREVESQRKTIQELRSAIVDLQRTRVTAEQGEVKVRLACPVAVIASDCCTCGGPPIAVQSWHVRQP